MTGEGVPASSRVFITGIAGFAGSHLAQHCLAHGHTVFGLTRDASRPPMNLAAIRDRISLCEGDVTEPESLARALDHARPALLFHLAAETTHHAPQARLLDVNVRGTAELLRAATDLPQPPRVHIASSSAVYGPMPDPQCAIDENTPVAPISTYGFSKAVQELLGDRLGAAYGLEVVRTRAFNHTGPREREDFFASGVARQLVRIERGAAPPTIRVGALDTVRDVCDVRDIVRGYYLALTCGRAGDVYNLASGSPVPIRTILDRLIALAGVPVTIEQDPARMRAADIPYQVGDAARARRELGWHTEITLDESLRALLEHWRSAPSD